MKRPSMQIGLGIVFGAALSAAVALIIGSAGMWLALGVAVGIAIGAAMFRKSNRHDRKLGASTTRARFHVSPG
jgi:hypothetical protein